MSPRVTVLMAVYNGERFIRPAIESVLTQTYRDFEFVIVDDASTDSTPQIIAGITDARARAIRNIANMGAGAARNLGLENARGEYVAVLDADDIALAERLETQVAFLDAHSDIALVGSSVELIDQTDAVCGILPAVQDSLALCWMLHLKNPIPHSSVMYRRAVAREVDGYDARLPLAEDYALWSKLSAQCKLVEIPQVLTRYRINPLGLARTRLSAMHTNSNKVVCRNVQRLIGEEISYSVAACLRGAASNAESVSESYDIYWLCLQAFHAQQCVPSNHYPLFEVVLRDLVGLARQDEAQRWRALAIAWRYAARYTPLQIMSPLFLNFGAKIVSPPSWRHAFRRAVPRKSDA